MSETKPPEKVVARRRGLTMIAAAVVLTGVAWGAWHWFNGRHYENTDNAYVPGVV